MIIVILIMSLEIWTMLEVTFKRMLTENSLESFSYLIVNQRIASGKFIAIASSNCIMVGGMRV